MPVDDVARYSRKARTLGDSVELVVVDRAGHFEVMAPRSERWPHIERALVDFSKRIEESAGE